MKILPVSRTIRGVLLVGSAIYLFKPFIPITNGYTLNLFCSTNIRIAELRLPAGRQGFAIADL
jgi:hypothetical protein